MRWHWENWLVRCLKALLRFLPIWHTNPWALINSFGMSVSELLSCRLTWWKLLWQVIFHNFWNGGIKHDKVMRALNVNGCLLTLIITSELLNQAHMQSIYHHLILKFTDLKDSDDVSVSRKLRLLSLLPKSRAYRILNSWSHPVSVTLRARQHSSDLLSGTVSQARKSTFVSLKKKKG